MCRVRELTTAKVGTLLHISGQVVRTHPIHPELVSGAFICLECQTAVPDVEQQFKFTQVCVTPPQVFLFTSYLALPFTPPLHLSSLVLALLLSFSILPHLPFPLSASPYHLLLSFHPFYLTDPLYFSPSPSMPTPSTYWSYITLTHSTHPSTFHPSLLVFHFTPLISSSTPLPLLPFSLPL